MNNVEDKWHSHSADALIKKLGSSLDGLSLEEAKRRLGIYGPNAISIQPKTPVFQRILNQFHNVLIYTLLIAAFFTACLQHWIDTGVIVGVVMLNAMIGYIQEEKAEKAIAALKNMLTPQSHVVREGKHLHMDSSNLVPGDIVLLHSGDKVPADVRLLETKNLQIQEAILTGESIPVDKNCCIVSENTPLAERLCMAYAGTLVTYGFAKGIVVSTGKRTEIGRISSMLESIPQLATPLIRQMAIFSRWLAVAILFFSLVIFLFGIFIRHYPIDEMFIAAVAIAVSAIPEGLPAVMTIVLAVGVTRMATHQAIVRRLPAVETLSSVTVICTDKTGTLTKNELTIQHVITAEHDYFVTGSGYNDKGRIHLNHQEVNLNSHPDLLKLIQAGLLCNDAALHKENESWHLVGNQIDGAFLALGFKANIDYGNALKQYKKNDFIPFDSTHKYMASLHHDHNGNAYIYVKGAPERILDMCSYQLQNQKPITIDKPFWYTQITKLAQNGMRVIGLAYRTTAYSHANLLVNDVEKNLIFLGLIGITDPPREEALHAVAQCQKAGVRIKIVTGDHKETARAIGRQLGIDVDQVLTGEDLDELDDALLAKKIDDIDIYARTTPEHKLRLINALREHDHIIAMTGDGVNDAPALKNADIGIAMGLKGTDVAKEASEIVLADDNFASIVLAVKEGRTVYDNLKKLILFLLPNDAGEGLTVFLAILIGYTLPITPLQILWVNLVTAVTLGLALAFEPTEGNIMLRKPRASREPLLSGFLLWRILFVSILFVVVIFGLFIYETHRGANLYYARTTVVNALVVMEIFYLINCRKIYDSVLNFEGLFGSLPVLTSISIVISLQIGFTYLPFMQTLFEAKPLLLTEWVIIISICIIMFVVIEFEKWVLHAIQKRKNSLHPTKK
ncbi:cation-translocating P-type ATPase [Legionella micdadei]|uniref:Cation-transporting ATPase pma1 n=2 Tax=Legionella micdadei TaxID=451 RepID=A0A098GDP1_LEGMI|nr:HAD-IC family P-type ATPase [Legionella micdadei]KTD29562.1 cation efflux transporter [Legionella micdadei]CEG59556.1 Cation-transporting ATPase pma1 [Legionella micdadei]SCX93564.1 plasma-membrane calcium-translocating P-type ATPase/potassium and/or sodium efflux P-type ATPase,TIGR01523 [Legionella micdadei]